jgi:hypothetical protein
VNRLDGSDRPEDRNSVVESYETHGASWLPPYKRREKRCGHPGHIALHLEPGILERARKETATLMFFVRELRVFVHELQRGEGNRSVRLDGRQDPLVVHDERQRDPRKIPAESSPLPSAVTLL